MPEDKKQDFLNYIQDELEIRIGQRIAVGLTEEQLQEFDSLSDIKEISKWLEKNRPDYHEIVNNCVAEMRQAIAQNRTQLLA
jgi:hypothetical protein